MLAEELLGEIERSELPAPDIAKKASRLARLLDDLEAMEWLRYEVAGYTPYEKGQMTPSEIRAAERSRRFTRINEETGRRSYSTSSLGWLQSVVDGNQAALSALSGSGPSGEQALIAENARRDQRYLLVSAIANTQASIDSIVGAIYEYVADRYQELRFGATVESAFEHVRAEVDAQIASLVPSALPRLSAAFENTASSNPEHWANAASLVVGS